MRILSRIFLVFILLLLILSVVCYIYIRLNGQQIVTTKLSETFDRDVSMKDIYFLFPFGIRIQELNINGMMEIKDVQIQMGPPDLVHKRLHFLFMSLSDPEVTLVRNSDSSVVFGDPSMRKNSEVPPLIAPSTPTEEKPAAISSAARRAVSKLNFIVDYLVMDRGQINFSDYSRKRDFHLQLQNINLKGQNFAYPIQNVNTKFDLIATVFKQDMPLSGSRVESRGVFNLIDKNMDSKLKVIEPDGSEGLSALLQSKNNNMQVTGKVQISNLVSKMSPENKPADTSFKDLVFSALQSSGVDIVVDFHFKTKMDDFQPDQISFVGNVGVQPEGAPPAEAQKSTDPLKNIGDHFEEIGRKFYKNNIENPPAPPSPAPIEKKKEVAPR